MFLSSFEILRKRIIGVKTISSLVHIGYNSFPDINSKVAQAVAFTLLNNRVRGYYGTYLDLTNKYSQAYDKESAYFHEIEHPYIACEDNFAKIPGSPVAYYFSNMVFNVFDNNKPLSEYGITRLGMTTADNDKFTRFWYEPEIAKCIFSAINSEEVIAKKKKWVPYNKGGKFRKWYGNLDVCVNWENDGTEIKSFADENGRIRSTVPNTDYYFKPCLTWSKVTSGNIAFRYRPQGSIFDVAGACLYSNQQNYMLGLLNSKVTMAILSVLSPSLNFEGGHISSIPIIVDREVGNKVDLFSTANISLSRADWDSFETSWDFKRHPLICGERTVAAAFGKWECETAERFDTLKANEEELNRIFIDIYNLSDELTPEVEDKDVTVRRADLSRDIRSLISYAVGCMFGRYSLDCEGLAFAGGEWDAGKYKTFPADKDNIIPICDDEYFDDDISGRFVDFVKTVYGADTLEENLKFIADALGGKGTPREVIRNYFLNDFYKDHCKIYQKRPIYWLFDSGKKNGFKALIYMHRYSRDLLAKLRTDYLHEQQERYRTQLSHIAGALNTATGAERARLIKQQDKLSEQSREIGTYEENVHHLADQNIAIDLDDGVKKNYEIFADVLAKI